MVFLTLSGTTESELAHTWPAHCEGERDFHLCPSLASPQAQAGGQAVWSALCLPAFLSLFSPPLCVYKCMRPEAQHGQKRPHHRWLGTFQSVFGKILSFHSSLKFTFRAGSTVPCMKGYYRPSLGYLKCVCECVCVCV